MVQDGFLMSIDPGILSCNSSVDCVIKIDNAMSEEQIWMVWTSRKVLG